MTAPDLDADPPPDLDPCEFCGRGDGCRCDDAYDVWRDRQVERGYEREQEIDQ